MRTEANLRALSEELTANCGDFYAACREVGVSPQFVRKWQQDDPKVAETLEEAADVGRLGLESEAIRRAVKGTPKGVYYMGEEVGTEIQYSDGLLQTLLKKRMKNVFGDDAAQTNVNVNLVNAIQVMPRASSYEEWRLMAESHDAPALPSPDERIEDALFDDVLPLPENDPAMADIL